MLQYKTNWAETKQRFTAWWRNENTDTPLMNVRAVREKPLHDLLPEEEFDNCEDRYLNVKKNAARVKNHYALVEPLADGLPQFSMDLGAGSMALYLGGEPVFKPETVWFTPFLSDYTQLPLRFDAENHWWRRHLAMIDEQVREVEGTDIQVCVPDIIENIDILAAIRGPQTVCYDLYDYPGEVKAAIAQINELYMLYYDEIYRRVRDAGGGSAFTAFSIWGPGKTAKVQCDFSAMISPAQFEEFVIPPLKEQCRALDNTLYHLDGPECLCHLPALMRLEELSALQYTPGDGNPRGADPAWDPVYRAVKEAGKGAWVTLWEYSAEDAVAYADRLVKTLGGKGFYFQFPVMSYAQAQALLVKAEKEWKIR